jgi:hypothetical protein
VWKQKKKEQEGAKEHTLPPLVGDKVDLKDCFMQMEFYLTASTHHELRVTLENSSACPQFQFLE